MIFTPLMDHQREPVDRAMAQHTKRDALRLGLFMFPGSGKSLVALTIAELMGAKNILITSNKDNVLTTWPEQIARHTDMECLVREREPVCMDTPTCYCINYDLLKECTKAYRNMQWDLWIGDESSEIKDPRTDRHMAVRFVTQDVLSRLILNASLMTEKLEDIYGQIVFIGGEARLGRTFPMFRDRYMQPRQHCPGWIPKRSAFTRIQRAIKDVAFFLPDTGEVEMPEPIYKYITVPLTKEQRKIDEELKVTFAACFKDAEIETNYAPVVFQKRVQLCGGIFRPTDEPENYEAIPTEKLGVLVRLCHANPDAKIAVWHQYIPETQLLRDALTESGITVTIAAGLSDKKKSEILTAFEEMDTGVLLIRTSMSKGLNQLADVDIAVLYSNPFSYQQRAQLEGRSRRVSSITKQTVYVDLVTEGGADALVYHSLTHKKTLSLTLDSLAKLVEDTKT